MNLTKCKKETPKPPPLPPKKNLSLKGRLLFTAFINENVIAKHSLISITFKSTLSSKTNSTSKLSITG